jgi:hypothetical protein
MYLTVDTPTGQMMGALAGAFLSFGFYRIALSQRENHTVFFILVAIVAASSAQMTKRASGGKFFSFDNIGRPSDVGDEPAPPKLQSAFQETL